MGHSRTRSFLALMLVTAAPLMAQNRGGGSGGTQGLSDRVEITYQQRYLETPSGRSDWMRFIVLWRGQPGWRDGRGVSAEERRQSEQAFREASAAATLAGRSVMGGSSGRGAYWAEVDRDESTIYILGAAYHVPVKDSTLVILVDRIDRVGRRGIRRRLRGDRRTAAIGSRAEDVDVGRHDVHGATTDIEDRPRSVPRRTEEGSGRRRLHAVATASYR